MCVILCSYLSMFLVACFFFFSTEIEPEQTGPLISPAALPKLNPEQLLQLQMAKKYCQSVTQKYVRDNLVKGLCMCLCLCVS